MRYPVYLGLLSALLMSACTGGETTPSTDLSPGHSENQQLTEVPWPVEDRVAAGVISDIEALGREIYMRSVAAYNDGDSQVLPAADDQLTWAMYRFQTGAYAFDRISFELTDITVPQKVWIGVSRYGLGGGGHWEWTMYSAGMGHIDVNWSSTRGPSGYAYLVIATHDFATARVLRSYVQVDMPTWDIHVIDDLNSPGATCAMERIFNNAAVVYERGDGAGGYQLMIAKANIARPVLPTDWTHRYIELSYPYEIASLEMTSSGGVPGVAVAHQGVIPGSADISYLHGINAFPQNSGEWHASALGTGREGMSLGLAIIDGNPAVAYEGVGPSTGSTVIYTRATKAVPESGGDWFEVVAGTDFSPTQDYSGFCLYNMDNSPALIFYDYSIGILRYAYSPLAMPSTTNDFTFASVDGAGIGELNTGIEYGGRPVVVYVDPVSGDTQYARGTKSDPASPGDFYQRHVIDTGVAAPPFFGDIDITRLEFGLGIAYRDFATGALMYAWDDGGTPGNGSAWKIVMVDPGPTSGNIEVIKMQDQNPGICYHTDSPGALMFAQMVP